VKGGLLAMYENERYLNIYPFISPNYCHAKYSKIQLQGKWLKDLGFIAGGRVSIKIINENDINTIIIKPIK
jgi:hypothetical protein